MQRDLCSEHVLQIEGKLGKRKESRRIETATVNRPIRSFYKSGDRKPQHNAPRAQEETKSGHLVGVGSLREWARGQC